MSESIIKAEKLTVKLGGKVILDNMSFDIVKGEQWAVVGSSGSGKTIFLETLAGQHFFQGSLAYFGEETIKVGIVLVEQQHHFRNRSNLSGFYYQQRFNASDSEDSYTVREDLRHFLGGNMEPELHEPLKEWMEIFGIRKLLDENMIQLSNGENKRLQITKALLKEPDLLLLDNPFLGLDVQTRKILEEVLLKISAKGIEVVLVLSHGELPSFITHVLSLSPGGKYAIEKKTAYVARHINEPEVEKKFDEHEFRKLVGENVQDPFEMAVRMNDVNIKYGDRKILEHINWKVRSGERWSLSGPNGAGKSTLLSLINADNPQAFANDMYLFDRKRGSGETIWEIKKKIGYISPELHLHFEKGDNCFEVVASGLFDTIGLFRRVNEEEVQLVKKWMSWLKIEHLQHKMLFQLSNSEQRLVLLARALVKNPPMLILDEPCQGLDEQQVISFRNLINLVAILGNKTLIYVSHYTDEIPDCVDKFIRLENGKVVEISYS